MATLISRVLDVFMSSNCEGYIYIVVLLQNCNETWRVNFIQAYTIYMIETAVAADEIFTTDNNREGVFICIRRKRTSLTRII